MIECDTMTRYNMSWAKIRKEEQTTNEPTTFILLQLPTPEVHKAQTTKRTTMAQGVDMHRNVWIYNAATATVPQAATLTGIDLDITSIEQIYEWKEEGYNPHGATHCTTQEASEQNQAVDWLIGNRVQQDQMEDFEYAIASATSKGANSIMATYTGPTNKMVKVFNQYGFTSQEWQMSNTKHGGAYEGQHTIVIGTNNVETMNKIHPGRWEAKPIADFLDNPNKDHATDFENHISKAKYVKRTKDDNATTATIAIQVQRQTRTDNWFNEWSPIYAVDSPGPDIANSANQWYDSMFAIEATDGIMGRTIRGIRASEM